MRVAVTGVGLLTGLGDSVQGVLAAMQRGDTAVGALSVPGLPQAQGAVVPGRAHRAWLKRRKDTKLLSRAAALLLPAAGQALEGWEGDRQELGLYFGVRREPPDDGEADPAIVASGRDGALDTALLAAEGRALYPPLLPLKTLPNLDLGHVSINLGVQGPTDTCAGGAAAGLQALRAGMWAVAEGRCPAALAGAAFSGVDGGSLRDRARQGLSWPPGEASVVLRIEPEGTPGALMVLEDGGSGFGPARDEPQRWDHQSALGDCETADGLLALVLGSPGLTRAADPGGAWTALQVVS